MFGWRKKIRKFLCIPIYVIACVSEREREREREK